MTQCPTCASCNEEHVTCGTEPWTVEGAFWVADLDAITWEERVGGGGREEGRSKYRLISHETHKYIFLLLLIRTNL